MKAWALLGCYTRYATLSRDFYRRYVTAVLVGDKRAGRFPPGIQSPGVTIAKQKVEISADGSLPLEEQGEMLECPSLSLERFSSGAHPKPIPVVENIIH